MEIYTGHIIYLFVAVALFFWGRHIYKSFIKPAMRLEEDDPFQMDHYDSLINGAVWRALIPIIVILLIFIIMPIRQDHEEMQKTPEMNFNGPSRDDIGEVIEVPEFKRRTEERLKTLREENAEISETIETEMKNDKH